MHIIRGVVTPLDAIRLLLEIAIRIAYGSSIVGRSAAPSHMRMLKIVVNSPGRGLSNVIGYTLYGHILMEKVVLSILI